MRINFISQMVTLVFSAAGFGQECQHSENIINHDFAFRASSDHGAVGEVVAIELSLMVENTHGGIRFFELTVAYDDSMVEFLGFPQYSEIYEQFIFYKLFNKIPDSYRLPGASGKAINMAGLFTTEGGI